MCCTVVTDPCSIRPSAYGHFLSAVPPIRIHTDCTNIIKVAGHGKEWCVRPECKLADLWQRFWHLVEELGGLCDEGVSLIKVKAHATKAERQAMGPRMFAGNRFADSFAKRGAATVQHPSWQRQAYIQKYHLVRDILECHARLGVLTHDIQDTKKTEYIDLEVPGGLEAVPESEPEVELAPCPQPQVQEGREHLIQLARGKGHHLVIRDSCVFCRRCCRHAQRRWQGLTTSLCKPADPRTSSGRLRYLWDRKNPKTGQPFVS